MFLFRVFLQLIQNLKNRRDNTRVMANARRSQIVLREPPPVVVVRAEPKVKKFKTKKVRRGLPAWKTDAKTRPALMIKLRHDGRPGVFHFMSRAGRPLKAKFVSFDFSHGGTTRVVLRRGNQEFVRTVPEVALTA